MAPWFSELDLTDATAPQRHIVRRVAQLLDTLQPARLLPHDQEAELAAGDGVEFLLRHDTAPWVTIEAWIASDEAGFFGMLTDETYSLGYPAEGEDDAIARLADLLTAPYSYEWFTVGGRPWQMVISRGSPADFTVHCPQGLWGLLPLNRWARRANAEYASFECQQVRRSGAP